MVTLIDKKLNLIKKLYYQEQYSQRVVAEKLGVSIDAVVYFMRKHNLKRRTLKEDSAVRFKNKPLSYCIKKNLTAKEQALKIIGITLYWGEGYKTEKSNGIDLANSDVAMVLVFLQFLRKICHVNESRLRVLLYCYSNQNHKSLVNFWSKATKIPVKQFTKPYVRKDFNYAKMDRMPNGMVHIRYADKKLLAVIKGWIEECKIQHA